MASLSYASQELAIYMGIPVLTGGVIGGLLNALVFLSLRTFCESSCVVYLTVMSFANIGQLLTTLLTRIMIFGFGIDWTKSSVFYCKFRFFCLQTCALLSMTCYCMATIDQYFATCFRPQWQQWCNIKVARRICLILFIVWLLHGVPILLFFDVITRPVTEEKLCTSINPIFSQYIAYFYRLILISLGTLVVSIIFGFLAHRTVPIVRRELDKQLTKMVLVQVLLNIFTIAPYVILLLIVLYIPSDSDPVVLRIVGFTNNFAILLYYSYYAVSVFHQLIVLESIFYLFLHIETISTPIDSCFIQNLSREMAKT